MRYLRWLLFVAACTTMSMAGASGAPAPAPAPVPAAAPVPAPAAERPAKAQLYDESADGAKQVAAALTAAKASKRRVLLMFGGNWCGWCHKLHRLFREDPVIAAKLAAGYQLVLIDRSGTRNADISRKYGQDENEGVPYLIVLDADGRVVTRQETGALEDGNHHDPAKVLAFLERWSP